MLTVLRHKVDHAHSICRTATGRSALFHLIHTMHPTCVLMPCFVPEGVIEPFRVANVPIIFYKLRADLTIDEDDLYTCMQSGRVLLVAINYFGYPSGITDIAFALQEQFPDTLILEDCAHALVGPVSEAPAADFVLYSLNKFLPVPDGAILISRVPSVDVTRPVAVPPLNLSEEAMEAYADHLRANRSIADLQAGDGTIFMALALSQSHYDKYYAEIGSLEARNQSALSLCAEWHMDRGQMAVGRYKNALVIHSRLDDVAATRLLRSRASPFAVPIVVRSPERERILVDLLKVGCVAAVMGERWDFIPKVDRFAIERRFFESHILLPCGEHILMTQIDAMCDALRGRL